MAGFGFCVVRRSCWWPNHESEIQVHVPIFVCGRRMRVAEPNEEIPRSSSDRHTSVI
jgi:hypothetical protein